MLTQLEIRRFKRFEDVTIELGSPVVFIGPNDSGKTTALQALALWELGVRRWLEKRRGKPAPEKRPGVTINRRDLVASPAQDAVFLWNRRRVRDVRNVDGKQNTTNILVELAVCGVDAGAAWTCGLEFDYANQESFYCRPLRIADDDRMPVPEQAGKVRIGYLPPMSGLAANESRLDPGAINVRLGEGRTAEVLRNLAYHVAVDENAARWPALTERISRMFGAKLDTPEYIAERGEIRLTYRDRDGTRLDLSSAGRGMQQTILLLAHLASNPGSVLLLDEPDAHLEILRQRQTYRLLCEAAEEQGSQIIAASHSEVVLNEAADRDVVIAFVGRPHRIDDRGSQVLKALKQIGFEHYYLAEVRGWALYLEGATDLAVLQAFAATLEHPAVADLDDAFVEYVGNVPSKARDHFYGLLEAKPGFVGLAVFDRLDTTLTSTPPLVEKMWSRREIENYLSQPETLFAWARASALGEADQGPLFTDSESHRREAAMRDALSDLVPPVAMRSLDDPWWLNTKASDDFLDRLFPAFFAKLGLPNLLAKSDYHVLAKHVPPSLVAAEVVEVLAAIHETAVRGRAAVAGEPG